MTGSIRSVARCSAAIAVRGHAPRVGRTVRFVVLLVLVQPVERAPAGAGDAADRRALAGAFPAACDRSTGGADSRAYQRADGRVLHYLSSFVAAADLRGSDSIAVRDRRLCRNTGARDARPGGGFLTVCVTSAPVTDDQCRDQRSSHESRQPNRCDLPRVPHRGGPPSELGTRTSPFTCSAGSMPPGEGSRENDAELDS